MAVAGPVRKPRASSKKPEIIQTVRKPEKASGVISLKTV
ncbi:MAG: hypothetical protein OP8BY_1096 [Candidatus Saccharicenans subterraneus]|uniref:Uncharacterized protein n=1 Tax=Candidatus Saccharicenans subterraneus TaxID=2508984 RepID=A0A3E2BR14_9BACT|nr:MAG: hypothetical protein OP8BY_1096 [Candidatus Saccharicenans subterraneum]